MPLEDLFKTEPVVSKSSPMSLNEFVYGKKAEKPGGFMGFLELLGRPQLAMGEAIGALARKEDPWKAAGRGISGERKYGTLGEQIFAPQEDPNMEAMEAMIKQAAALGVDVLTDPAWLVGLPAAGKITGLASKLLPKARNLPLMRQAAKYVVPITTQLRWFGGKAGKKIATLFEVADDTASLRAAQVGVDLARAAAKHGVGKSRALREAAVEHLEKGLLRQGVVHPDQRIQGFATYMDDITRKLGLEIETFKDPGGKGFEIVEPVLRSLSTELTAKANRFGLKTERNKEELWKYITTGEAPAVASKGFYQVAKSATEKLDNLGASRVPGAPSVFSKSFYQRPFQSIEDYFPHLATPDFLKSISTDEGFSKAAKELAKLNKISEIDAADILKNLGTPRKAGNIEYARTMKMIGYEKDPLKALPRYFEQVFNRVEYAKRFGVQGQQLKTLLKGAVTKRIRTREGGWRDLKGISKADAMLIRDTILGKPVEKTGLERVARAIMGYQVMTKMGPLSTLANISQHSNTIIKEGGVSFLKGVLRSMTDEGTRQGAIAYSAGIHEHLLRMMGATGKGAEWWLRKTWFTGAERLNRLVASNAGIVSAERLIRQSNGKLTQNLLKRGLTQGDLGIVKANNWKLPTELADKVGLIASNATQHVTRLKDIPLAWQSPGIRMMVQFKSFVYQQTRFLLREMVSPALEFFNTNGKKGAVAPLLRGVAAFGLGGQLVAHIRDQAKNLTAGLLKMDYDPREPIPDDWALRVLEDSLNMGGLGVAGDLVQRAARRDFKGWLLGPSYGDLSDLIEMTATGGAEMYKKGEPDLARIGAEALRHIPFVSPIIPKRGLKGEVEEKLSGLEALFYGR